AQFLEEQFALRLGAVDVEEVIDRVVGDVGVGFAVAVVVGDDDAEALAPAGVVLIGALELLAGLVRRTGHNCVHVGLARRAEAGLLADVGEALAGVVAEQVVRDALELLGRADVAGLAVVGAVERVVVLEGPVGVLADVQVGVAVAVEVGPAGA